MRSTLPAFSSGSTSESESSESELVVYIITRGGGGEDSGPLPPEVVPVLEEPVAVVLVEDVPVLPRVALVLLDPKLMT